MNPTREEVLFALALENPAEKRAAFLDGACLGDVARRTRVEGGRTLHFLNPATREITRSMPLLAPGERSSTYISNLRFSPDGSRLAAAHPDGRHLAVTRENGDISVWNLPEMEAAIAQAGLTP